MTFSTYLLLFLALVPIVLASQDVPPKVDKQQFMRMFQNGPASSDTELDDFVPVKTSSKKKIFSGSSLTKKVKEVYKDTKSMITQEVSSLLKLDSKGRLKALLEEVEGDIKYVRREFSLFTIPWSPMMKRALNYVGATNLNRLKWDKDNELDFSLDALRSLAMGYEFMRIMMAWRENMLVSHEAYRMYLESMRERLLEERRRGENNFHVDEDVIYRLKVIHNNMLLAGWVAIEDQIQEPVEKIAYLSGLNHEKPADFENQYLRDMFVYEEMLKMTMDSFKEDHKQMVDTVREAKMKRQASDADFEESDEFFDDFREALADGQMHNIVWEVPYKVDKFMSSLRGQLQYNSLIYQDESMLRELKQKATEQSEE